MQTGSRTMDLSSRSLVPIEGEAEGEVEGETPEQRSGVVSEIEGDVDDADADADAGSRPSTPARGRPSRAGRRRVGRPAKGKPLDGDALDASNVEAAAEAGTPLRRRRGRPFAGGGRWGKPRGGPSHVSQQPLDKDGNILDVVDDEVVLPEDPEGETKVNKWGHLQGGRQYRCRTFTIQNHDERLFMLSTEPARCIGFRDSYLFFQKHKRLFKIIVDDAAKRDLIVRDVIPHSYKGRAIGVVTARSVFREFGARIIVGGRTIIDDYEVAAARAQGVVEGELADPHDRLPPPGEPYNQNQYVAWHGASSVYHSGAPSVPMPAATARAMEKAKRKRVVMTDENWLLEHARACSEANSQLSEMRRAARGGVYDVYTNMMHYPGSMHPTRARWERVSDPVRPAAASQNIPRDGDDNQDDQGEGHLAAGDPPAETIFTPLPPGAARRFLIVDVVMRGPPMPEEHGGVHSRAPLDQISDEVLALLPLESRQALEREMEREREHRRRWGDFDERSTHGHLPTSYIVPRLP